MDPYGKGCGFLATLSPEHADNYRRSGADYPCVCDLSAEEDLRRDRLFNVAVLAAILAPVVVLILIAPFG